MPDAVPTAFRYAMTLYAEDWSTLGDVVIDPDWEPARECATFSAIRRGLVPPLTPASAAAVEPVWDGRRGAPHVGAFRLTLPTPQGPAVASEVPLTYILPLAQRASAGYVEQGRLKPGEVYRYQVCAFPAPEADGRAAAGGFVVEETVQPLPLRERSIASLLDASVHTGPVAGDDDVPVFVPQRVLDEAAGTARAAGDVETGGVLVGHLHRDPDGGEIFAAVTAQIPARHTRANATKLTFTPETWAAVDAAIALRRAGEVRLGWWHAHPDWCRKCPPENRRQCTLSNACFSADDVHLHRVCFARAYHVALLVSDHADTGMTWSSYGWQRGLVAARGFRILTGPVDP